jgi:hypothetical protein
MRLSLSANAELLDGHGPSSGVRMAPGADRLLIGSVGGFHMSRMLRGIISRVSELG